AANRADTLCPRITNPYFYAVEKAHQASYILGTRHLGVALEKFPQVVRDKLAASRLVVLEIAPGDDHHSQQAEVSLPAVLSPADWTHYQELVGETPERESVVAATLVLTVIFEDWQTRLEDDIEHTANAAHIPTSGLE